MGGRGESGTQLIDRLIAIRFGCFGGPHFGLVAADVKHYRDITQFLKGQRMGARVDARYRLRLREGRVLCSDLMVEPSTDLSGPHHPPPLSPSLSPRQLKLALLEAVGHVGPVKVSQCM